MKKSTCKKTKKYNSQIVFTYLKDNSVPFYYTSYFKSFTMVIFGTYNAIDLSVHIIYTSITT